MSNSFPLAVREAFGGRFADGRYIPCLKPCSGLKLLQFVEADHVEELRVQTLPPRSIKMLVNHGHNGDTLIEHMDDRNIKSELQGIVDAAGTQDLPPLDHTLARSMMAGVCMAIEGSDNLASIGLKTMTHRGWSLSSIGSVTKRTVSKQRLDRLLRTPDVTWDINPILGVVTAIYVVKGGFTFTGEINDVARVGVQFDTPPAVPVGICAGLHYTLTGQGGINVTGDDPREWIIAIELHKTNLCCVQRPRNPVKLEDSGNANPPDSEMTFEA